MTCGPQTLPGFAACRVPGVLEYQVGDVNIGIN